jgi:hypothetical protein
METKPPGSCTIFQMLSEPQRLGEAVKAVSERNWSLITSTSPPFVRIQNS